MTRYTRCCATLSIHVLHHTLPHVSYLPSDTSVSCIHIRGRSVSSSATTPRSCISTCTLQYVAAVVISTQPPVRDDVSCCDDRGVRWINTQPQRTAAIVVSATRVRHHHGCVTSQHREDRRVRVTLHDACVHTMCCPITRQHACGCACHVSSCSCSCTCSCTYTCR